MKSRLKFLLALLAFPVCVFTQTRSTLDATLDRDAKVLHVKQRVVFKNTSSEILTSIVLNDWNNAYSAKDTPLAKRFSDEFTRGFHLAKIEERGHTDIISVTDDNGSSLNWFRPEKHPDLVEVKVNGINPGEEISINIAYHVKLPSDRFTRYGYNKNGNFYLKDCFLMPARFENGDFVRYSNNNLDDIANTPADWKVTINVPNQLKVTSDLKFSDAEDYQSFKRYVSEVEHRSDFSIYLQPEPHFLKFSNDIVTVFDNMSSKHVDDIKKAVIVDQVVRFVGSEIPGFSNADITVSETDYDRNPFYGLSQLPSFLNVFDDDFVYELKFLKTYTYNYLHNSLQLDPRKDNWVYDAIQIKLMMDYMQRFHPDAKMTGRLAKYRLLRSYAIITEPFDGQYSYFYMLMARKNLDQPVGDAKDKLLKFNEQIAGKYRAGLSLKYLDAYLGNGIVDQSIREFMEKAHSQSDASDFISILKSHTDKDISWFYDTVINTRDLIDFKFDKVSKTDDSVSFTLKNRTNVNVPIPVYGIKDKQVVFKQWIDNPKPDSVYTFKRNGAEKLAINYEHEAPEYNERNNYYSLGNLHLTNRPVKFVFFKDLEDPYYNQVLYVPTVTYNLYDGLSPGMRLYNKTILDKAFSYDINPMYSSKTQSISGSAALVYNDLLRDGRLYDVKYYLTGSYFHYAPDATYFKVTPSLQFKIRGDDFRDNRKQFVTLREVVVERQPTNYIISGDRENYAVFNARYTNTKTEVTSHFNIQTDFQAASDFGKATVELGYRKLFDDNRQLELRMFAGTFLYNRTQGDYFSFALDRPTDYLFDNNYYGRSEKTGLFSQQIILAEGGFKSKLDTPFANQWITTLNAGMNVWNWVEIYGDGGFIKNHDADVKFRYDSGVRFNLVTDYFELYFPVYSSNGWEFQKDYSERIRFIVTLDPKILVNLFTRKWF